jgi:hypothetical protein
MPKSFIALITPMEKGGGRPDNSLPGGQGGRPDNTLPGSQPGIDNTLPGQLPRPEHPIYYPIPPGGIIDNTLPGQQPGIDNTLPGSQPGIDNTLPGSQPKPEQPIYLPPGSGNWEPIFIWGPSDPRPGTGLPGQQPGRPDNTLPPGVDNTLPPDGETSDGQPIKYVPIWTPTTGWITVGIVLPEGPTVTPSKR